MKFPSFFKKLSLSNISIVNRLSIRNRLIVLASSLLVILAVTNVYLKVEISSANDALREQTRITEELKIANSALRAFGEQKYWLTDLAVSWLNESEDNAEKSKEKLESALKLLQVTIPKKAKKIGLLANTVMEKSLEAVDAYVDKNRVLGNSILSQARNNIVAIDKILVEYTDVLREKIQETQKKSMEEETIVDQITIAVIVLAVAFATLMTWIIVLSIGGQLNSLTQVMGVLAGGDHTVDIMDADRDDEIGKMAQAVQVFKDNAIERERLEIETEEQRQKANLEQEERQKREAQRQAEEMERQRQDQEAEADRQREETEREKAALEAEAKHRREAREVEERQKRLAEEERVDSMNRLADDFEAQVLGVVELVTNSASEMTETADDMVHRTTAAQENSNTVSAASETASGNVQTVAAAADQLSKSISEISHQVSRSSTMSAEAVNDANVTNEKVQSLSEAADKIGEVVELINDIASQTNLLALNATIEAARAGEAGKGFAVVASEVGNLANQTAKATDEIASQIDNIQSATHDSVAAIGGITKTISKINEIATSIASAVEEQGAATQEIARNVEQASTGTQEVTATISDIAAEVSSTSIAAENVLSSAKTMTTQSEKLADSVHQFLANVRVEPSQGISKNA